MGVEYLTHWVFTPMEPGPMRDALLQDLKEKLEEMEAEDEKQ